MATFVATAKKFLTKAPDTSLTLVLNAQTAKKNQAALQELANTTDQRFKTLTVDTDLGKQAVALPAHSDFFHAIKQNACGEGSPVMASNALRLLPHNPGHYLYLDLYSFMKECSFWENQTTEENSVPVYPLFPHLLEKNFSDQPITLLSWTNKKDVVACQKEHPYSLSMCGCCYNMGDKVSNASFGIVTTEETWKPYLNAVIEKFKTSDALLDLTDPPALLQEALAKTPCGTSVVRDTTRVAGVHGARSGKEFLSQLFNQGLLPLRTRHFYIDATDFAAIKKNTGHRQAKGGWRVEFQPPYSTAHYNRQVGNRLVQINQTSTSNHVTDERHAKDG